MSEEYPGVGQVLGGLTRVVVNNELHDVVIYEAGLLLMRAHAFSEPKQVREMLGFVPIDELLRRHRFILFTDVVHAKVVKPGVTSKVELGLSNGDNIEIAEKWTSDSLGKNDSEMFQDMVRNLRYNGPMQEENAAQAARTWAENAIVLDAMSNVTVNGTEYDLVILDTGLVFIADPGKFHHGKKRLTSLVDNMPVYEIVGRNWMVWYEQVVGARIDTTAPVVGELELYDGRTLSFSEGKYVQSLTDDIREVLCAVFRSVGAPAPA